LHRQRVFQALIRVRLALLVKQTVEIALRQQVDRDKLPACQ
jgi:hypothetical protein